MKCRSHLLYDVYHCKKIFVSFSTPKGSHYPTPNRFYYFRKLVRIGCISKRICYLSLSICHFRETREHHQLKFKVCKLNLQNRKKSKNYFSRESFIDQAIQSNRSFLLGQIPLKIMC